MCGGISSDSQIARTVPWIASGLRAAICSAMSARALMQLVVRHDLAHQTEAQRGLGGEALLGTHQRPAQHVTERARRGASIPIGSSADTMLALA